MSRAHFCSLLNIKSSKISGIGHAIYYSPTTLYVTILEHEQSAIQYLSPSPLLTHPLLHSSTYCSMNSPADPFSPLISKYQFKTSQSFSIFFQVHASSCYSHSPFIYSLSQALHLSFSMLYIIETFPHTLTVMFARFVSLF